MLKSRLKQNFYSELGCSWVALSCSNKDVSLGGVMSRHELRPHVHSACAHFRCLSSKEALGPSLEDARTTIRVPVIGQRARFSMLACALAVTLPHCSQFYRTYLRGRFVAFDSSTGSSCGCARTSSGSERGSAVCKFSYDCPKLSSKPDDRIKGGGHSPKPGSGGTYA